MSIPGRPLCKKGHAPGGSHDQANQNARDRALTLGASGRGEVKVACRMAIRCEPRRPRFPAQRGLQSAV